MVLPQASSKRMLTPVGKPGTVQPNVPRAAPELNTSEGMVVALISSSKNRNATAVVFVSFWENEVR